LKKAAKLRDRISDLKYLGEKIDFLPSDTEQILQREKRRSLEK